jgi:hypothetical protein
MNGFGRGNLSTRRKPAPTLLCPTLFITNPTCQTRARTRAAAVGSQWLTASAMTRPFNLPNTSSLTVALGSTQFLTKMRARNLPGGKKRPARRADNHAAICVPNVSIVQEVGWAPEPVQMLWSKKNTFASAGNRKLAVQTSANRHVNEAERRLKCLISLKGH